MARILVVEDDREINALLCGILGRSGYSAESASSGAQGLHAFSLVGASLQTAKNSDSHSSISSS